MAAVVVLERRCAGACALAAVLCLIACGGSDSGEVDLGVLPPVLDAPVGMAAGTGGVGGSLDVGSGVAGAPGSVIVAGGTGGAMAGAGGAMAGVGGAMAGMDSAMAGTGGTMMTGGPCGSGMPTDGRPTTGPLACIVEQHNAVRAMVNSGAPLPPLTWSADIAKYAQEWTDMTCMAARHRSDPMLDGEGLGENLYVSFGGTDSSTAGKEAVDGWAAEVACYTFGPFFAGDKCDMACTSAMNSDGCGHYTQIVWRASTEIGCGVTTCGSGFFMSTEVICNYGPAGNFVGQKPY